MKILTIPSLQLHYRSQQRLFLYCISFIFFSCGQPQKETPKENDSLSHDSITPQAILKSNYWPLDTDTLVSEKTISLYHQPYKLKIIKYCLNDSAVINEVWHHNESGNGTYKTLDISHNYAQQIILTKGNEVIFDKHLSKDIFKDHLDASYYEREILYDIKYDSISTNKLRFKATLVVPNTELIEEAGFAVFYQTEKAGQLELGVKPEWVTYDDLVLYDFRYHDKNPHEKVGFVSLSDNYPLSEHPDSLAIPDLSSVKDDKYFRLGSTYRKRFLTKTKISETDNVFIYNYHNDTIASFAVKNLDVVACLNPYAGEDDRPYSQYDYMIGFEIDKNLLKDLGIYFYETLVFAGKENPFVQGQLKAPVWKKIEPVNFPSKAISTKNTLLLRKYDKGNTYTYESTSFRYFVQEFLESQRNSARRLLVIDLNTKETVCDIFYFDSEGSSLAPLNSTGDDNKSYNQWTGELFKKKPPVIFGFEYISFGCPSISFLNLSVSDVGINCDNRH